MLELNLAILNPSELQNVSKLAGLASVIGFMQASSQKMTYFWWMLDFNERP